ncbi:unnamed protein product [Polarella glacialis]|uniref:C3H1-type domain-containing protein n=1 Tax=Polarella glacialis TaxID=89957 RepID=A0A813KH47_POLGL|nr:unnamed protein product [Polarella glacialis]CAE8702007.1 unnamed protein product [Polarella glacialis]
MRQPLPSVYPQEAPMCHESYPAPLETSLDCRAAAAGMDSQRLYSELFTGLYDAAHTAFGSGNTASVALLSDGMGFEVWLQGGAALELLRGREEDLLSALERHLWPTLGREYLGAVRRVQGPQDAYGYPATPGFRLAVWRAIEDDHSDERCWDFIKCGTCGRGDACRWMHTLPETFQIDIKVSASAPEAAFQPFAGMPRYG